MMLQQFTSGVTIVFSTKKKDGTSLHHMLYIELIGQSILKCATLQSKNRIGFIMCINEKIFLWHKVMPIRLKVLKKNYSYKLIYVG